MTRSYKLTGRQSSRLSPYHQRKREYALARVRLMRAMQASGLSLAEIGRRFGVSGPRVVALFRKYPEGTE